MDIDLSSKSFHTLWFGMYYSWNHIKTHAYTTHAHTTHWMRFDRLYTFFFQDCCEQLLDRLAPLKASNPDAEWEQWIKEAYLQRINLSAQGFYKTPNINMNWETGKGSLYAYFAYGAACSEVEVDTLTGDFTALRTDIVMDVGDSINPAIDIGQVLSVFMLCN